MEEAIRDPRMVLSVVIPRTAGAASATRTTEEAEDWHRIARAVSAVEATVEMATIEQATTLVEEATMLDPSMVLLVVALRTAVQGRVATRTM